MKKTTRDIQSLTTFCLTDQTTEACKAGDGDLVPYLYNRGRFLILLISTDSADLRQIKNNACFSADNAERWQIQIERKPNKEQLFTFILRCGKRVDIRPRSCKQLGPIHTYIYICMYVCVRMCVCVCECVYVCVVLCCLIVYVFDLFICLSLVAHC